MEPDLEPIVEGLVDRVKNLLSALDRQDRLETAREFVGWLDRQRRGTGLADAGREILLRALKAASDPLNYEILRRLDPLEAIELPALMRLSGLGRVAASERVHDLVQAGLASRELIGDQIRGTALATGLVTLIESLAGRSGERLARALAPAAPSSSAERG